MQIADLFGRSKNIFGCLNENVIKWCKTVAILFWMYKYQYNYIVKGSIEWNCLMCSTKGSKETLKGLWEFQQKITGLTGLNK
mgnify:CR=1 FL=1